MTTNEEAATLGSRISRHIAMVAICLMMFHTFMVMTIVSVAFGNVQSNLHAGVMQL